MSQVTIYIDEETEARTRAAAEAAGVSLSRWISQMLRARARTDWPAEVVALEGAWRTSTGEPPDSTATGADLAREPL